jgi:hypothetical protein
MTRKTPVTISSEVTPLFKFVLPALVVIGWAALVATLFVAPSEVVLNGVRGAPPGAAWQVAGWGLAVVAYLVWLCSGIYRVQLAGDAFILSNYIDEVRVPADQFEHVPRWWLPRMGLVTIVFREPTPFGRRVSFVPEQSWLGMIGLGLVRRLRRGRGGALRSTESGREVGARLLARGVPAAQMVIG